jgi:hypothetical protein
MINPLNKSHILLPLILKRKKMKSITTILPLAFLSILPSLVSAAGSSSGWGTISEFYVSGNGAVIRIRFSEEIINPGECGAGEFYMKELDDSAGSNRFYSAMLAAYSSKKQVQFWVLGCTDIAWWGNTRPVIHEVSIRD